MPGSPALPTVSYDPQVLLNSQPVIVTVIDPADHSVQFQNQTGLGAFGGDMASSPVMKNCGKNGAVRNSAICPRPLVRRGGVGTGGHAERSPSAGALGGPDEKTARVHVIETIIGSDRRSKQGRNKTFGSRRRWRHWGPRASP